MYDPADPLLARLSALALAFPESSVRDSHGRPAYFAGKKVFATYGVTEDHAQSLVFKPDPEDRAALLEDDRVVVPPYYGPGGWLALDLAAREPDWDEVRELLDASYRQVALKRMLAALDAR
jgi:predicted DNA-binding protein (MmcQ/YjbR family)